MTPQEINEAVARKLGDSAYCGCDHLVKDHSDRKYGSGPAVCSHGFCKCEEIEIPDYSTDIKAAWEIVEVMLKEHVVVLTMAHSIGYSCQWGEKETIADTAPLAICLAFLKLND